MVKVKTILNIPTNNRKRKTIVKKTSWVNGLLETVEELFDAVEDAFEYAENAIDSEICKVYNELGELLHVKQHRHRKHEHEDDDDGYNYPNHHGHHQKND